MEVTTVGVDLAKDVFQVALANRAGRVIGHRRLTRRQFERFFDALPTGTAVVMESCGTAHYWGRRGQAAGCTCACCPSSTFARTSGGTRRIGWMPRPSSKRTGAARFGPSR